MSGALFGDWVVVILALIAAGCGVIGMIASISELVTTREYLRRLRRMERRRDR